MTEKSFVDNLSEILIKNGLISRDDADVYKKEFEKSSKESFDDFLLEAGLIDERDLLRALSQHYQVPAIDVIGIFFDRELLNNFPKNFLLREVIVPLQLDGNILIVVASNPDDADLLSKIGEYVSADIQFQVGLRRDILEVIREFYEKSDTEIGDDEEVLDEDLDTPSELDFEL